MKRIFLSSVFTILYASLISQVNLDFENTLAGQYTTNNAVLGWTIDAGQNSGNNGVCVTNTNYVWNTPISEFWIASTPIFSHPQLGTIPNSPLGGTRVAQLQNTTGGILMTRISTTFPVTSTTSLYQFAYCGSWDGSGHACCDQPYSRIELLDCSGNLLSCYSLNILPGNPNCPSSSNLSVTTSGISYTNWQLGSFDLTPFIGSCVKIRVIAGDCDGGAHHGMMYFDSRATGQLSGGGLTQTGSITPVAFCPGSNLATITAPLGYLTYTWTAPSGFPISSSQQSLSVLTITNPVLGNTYSLSFSNSNGCTFNQTYTLTTTTVNVGAIGSSSSCVNGTSGSATVQANGSGSGYNYSWVNAQNVVVGTTSVLSNMPGGNYTISLTANSATNCGSGSASINIGISPLTLSTVAKPFCGTTAYLAAAQGSGYQWYNGTSLISSTSGGTAQTFTVSNALSNSFYIVTSMSSQGCRDSVKFILGQAVVGPLGIKSETICLNATNGNATITIPPNASQPGNNYFIISSTGSTTAYTASLMQTSASTFTISNISGNGTYSISAFDGSCTYTSSFYVPVHLLDYTLSPSGTSTVCAGISLLASVNFNNSPYSAYTYSWVPTPYFAGGTGFSTSISPLFPPGTQTTLVYSVIVTPTVANCPMIKTMTVVSIYPLTPTFVTSPSLCNNASRDTLKVIPSGGTFGTIPGVSSAGVITPSLCSPNTYYIPYTNNVGGCTVTTTGTFVIKSLPVVSVSGNTTICSGQTTTLFAVGAQSYLWSNTSAQSSPTVSPAVTTNYSVTGTGTNGCSVTRTITVKATPVPTLVISGNTVCDGNTATLSVSGAASYSWSTGNATNILFVPPSAYGQFAVTGLNSTLCKSTTTTAINVTSIPNLSVSGNKTVCKGERIMLTASGADSYSWNTNGNGAALTATVFFNSIFSVTGYNDPGHCSNSLNVIVNVDECTALQEVQKNSGGLTIYPNPNNGSFKIESSHAGEVVVIDQWGRSVLTIQLQQGKQEVNLSFLNSGVYLLKTSFGGTFTTRRLVLQH